MLFFLYKLSAQNVPQITLLIKLECFVLVVLPWLVLIIVPLVLLKKDVIRLPHKIKMVKIQDFLRLYVKMLECAYIVMVEEHREMSSMILFLVNLIVILFLLDVQFVKK